MNVVNIKDIDSCKNFLMFRNNNIEDNKFLNDYWILYKELLFDEKNDELILNFRDAIKNTVNKKGRLIFFGNGASASLCSHAATDFTKQAKIPSIAFNDHNLITALSNDYGYDQWVCKALEYYSMQNDMVIFISVSGESPNLINGINYTKNKGLKTGSLTGSKKNNTLKSCSDNFLWVNSSAYNIVESIHTIWLTLIIDLVVGKASYKVNN